MGGARTSGSTFAPGRMMLRNDSDPLDQWSGPVDVFGEGIYHGEAKLKLF